MTTKIDKYQGRDGEGRPFGYLHGTDGGWFFTWGPTLSETLDSVEADEADGPGGLTRDRAVAILRAAMFQDFASQLADVKEIDKGPPRYSEISPPSWMR